MQKRKSPMFVRSRVLIILGFFFFFLGFVLCWSASAQTCPISDGTTDSAKSHTLYLYFPTADDNTFPTYAANVSPAKAFDATALSPGIGSTAALIDRIHSVVVDDYCEFNVRIIATTTNPASLPMPPARRTTVAVGSDSDPGGAWGQAQEVDIGDAIDVDFARVWGGTYTTCEGATPTGCTTTGSLTGANATWTGGLRRLAARPPMRPNTHTDWLTPMRIRRTPSASNLGPHLYPARTVSIAILCLRAVI